MTDFLYSNEEYDIGERKKYSFHLFFIIVFLEKGAYTWHNRKFFSLLEVLKMQLVK